MIVFMVDRASTTFCVFVSAGVTTKSVRPCTGLSASVIAASAVSSAAKSTCSVNSPISAVCEGSTTSIKIGKPSTFPTSSLSLTVEAILLGDARFPPTWGFVYAQSKSDSVAPSTPNNSMVSTDIFSASSASSDLTRTAGVLVAPATAPVSAPIRAFAGTAILSPALVLHRTIYPRSSRSANAILTKSRLDIFSPRSATVNFPSTRMSTVRKARGNLPPSPPFLSGEARTSSPAAVLTKTSSKFIVKHVDAKKISIYNALLVDPR